MAQDDMTELRRKVIKVLKKQGGQVRRTLLFNRLWRERRGLLERALAFLEADDLIATGKLRQSKRGPPTQYFWLTPKGLELANELTNAIIDAQNLTRKPPYGTTIRRRR